MRSSTQYGRFILALIVIAMLNPLPSAGQQFTEEQVKAGFLFNFAKFVEWPASSFAGTDSAITICVVGNNDFGATLESIVHGKLAGARPVTVRRMRDPREDYRACHMVYFSAFSTKAHSELLVRLRNSSILTVGDSDDFAASGGMITFFLEDARVRFAINPEAARQANLHISSRLLSLAKLNANLARRSGG